MTGLRILSVFIIILTSLQVGWAKESKISIQAEKTEARLSGKSLIKRYINLKAKYDGLKIKADSATYLEGENKIKFQGNSSIEDSVFAIKANKILCPLKEDKAIAEGGVLVKTKGEEVKANRVVYFRERKVITAEGDVVLRNSEGTKVSGEFLRYSLPDGVIFLPDSPQMLKGMRDGEDIKMVSEQMHIFPKEGKITASEDVHIYKGNLEISAQRGIYLGGEDKLTVQEKARIVQAGMRVHRRMEGEEIQLLFSEENIAKISIVDSAELKEVGEGKKEINELRADTIKVYMKEQKPERILAMGNVRSSYRAEGVNRVSGEKVILFFEDGELHRVLVEGKASGKYCFPPERKHDLYAP